MKEQVFHQLESVRSIKKSQIEDFFSQRQSEASALVDTAQVMKSSVNDKMLAIQALKKESLQSEL